MQNNAKQCKNDLFEEILFEDVGEKASKFDEFSADHPLPERIVEWEVPYLAETIEKEARKFRVYPYAIKSGQTIAYILVMSVSFAGQVVWFLFLVLVSVLASVLEAVFGQGHGAGQRHSRRQGHGQGIDWRDVPTGQGQTSEHHVRQSGQGHKNNVHVHVNITNH